jgi:hypothetical protein
LRESSEKPFEFPALAQKSSLFLTFAFIFGETRSQPDSLEFVSHLSLPRHSRRPNEEEFHLEHDFEAKSCPMGENRFLPRLISCKVSHFTRVAFAGGHQRPLAAGLCPSLFKSCLFVIFFDLLPLLLPSPSPSPSPPSSAVALDAAEFFFFSVFFFFFFFFFFLSLGLFFFFTLSSSSSSLN